MDNITKKILEFTESVHLVKVNSPVFEERFYKFDRIGKYKSFSLSQYYSEKGELIGCIVWSNLTDEEHEYYIPRERSKYE